MNIKRLFERYIDNQNQIIFCNREIELRKLVLSPSMTSQIDGLPSRPTSISRPTERTVFNWDKDYIIHRNKRRIHKCQTEIETVDKLIDNMDDTNKLIFSRRYREGVRVSDIAEELFVDPRDIYRNLQKQIEYLNKLK